MTKVLQQLFAKSGENTAFQPAAAAPAQGVLVKPEPAEREEDGKSNASRQSTPRASPQHTPAKTKVTQPVEQPPVAVAPELKSGDATGAVTNTVNTTGTTPTTSTTDSRDSNARCQGGIQDGRLVDWLNGCGEQLDCFNICGEYPDCYSCHVFRHDISAITG